MSNHHFETFTIRHHQTGETLTPRHEYVPDSLDEGMLLDTDEVEEDVELLEIWDIDLDENVIYVVDHEGTDDRII